MCVVLIVVHGGESDETDGSVFAFCLSIDVLCVRKCSNLPNSIYVTDSMEDAGLDVRLSTGGR